MKINLFFTHIFHILYLVKPFFSCIVPLDQCPMCSYDQYDLYYRNNYQLKVQTSANCQGKNVSFYYERKIFIFNSSQVHDLPSFAYSATYSSVIQAFETENYLAQEFLYGRIEFIFEDGDHFLLRNNLTFGMEELFRRSLIDIIIKPSENFANLILKTNEFYLFISASFSIENIHIYGNDIVIQKNNELNACYNTFTKFCCNEKEFKDSFPNDTNLCALQNYEIQSAFTKKSNFYGLFNLEFIFEQNYKFPSLTIKNCKFYYLLLIDIEKGFSSLISLAPLSGSLQIWSCEFIDLYTPSGLVYYSSSNYDQIYSNFLFSLIEKNSSYQANILMVPDNISFISSSIKYYNNYHIDILVGQAYGIFSFVNFKGLISIENSSFNEINLALGIIIFKNNIVSGSLNIKNCSFNGIFNSKLFSLLNIKMYSLNQSLFYFIENQNYSLGEFSFINSIIFYNLSFENLNSTTENSLFLVDSSDIIISNNIFTKFDIGDNLLFFKNSSLKIKDCQFFDFTMDYGLLFAQNLNNLDIISTSFQNFRGLVHLIYGENIDMVNIYLCLFKNISNYNIFELDTVTYFNFTNSSILICSIVFVVNRDLNLKYLKFFGGEISNNSILKGILWKNNVLYFDSVFESIAITHNNYSYQALFKIYSANHVILDKVRISFNFFLSPDSYCCVMDLEGPSVQVWNSYFQSNGLIENPIARPRTLDSDCFFDFYYNDFNEFFNNVFVGDRHSDMTGGFLCCATCGKYLFIENNTFLVLETNPKFGYKGILMDFPYITLKNLSFWNIPGSLNNFYFKNGALLFYASTSYFYKENENVLVMENLNFYNCSSYYGGGLVIISYKTVILKNCSFFNNSAKFYGGNFGLIAGKNVTLDSIYIENSEASFASGAYIKTIDLISIKNLEINSSFSHGIGVIYLRDINLAKLEKVRSQSTYSLSNGGLFFLFNVHLIINDLSVTDSSSSAYGGVFYVDFNSDININKTYCKNVRADEAGGFISLNSAMNVSISNTHILNVSSLYGGVFSFLLLVKNVIFFEILIENSYSENGVGLSFIKTYDDTAIIKFESVKSINCSAVEGSFLYFLSNSQLYLKNITVMKNLHNCIYISYTFQIKVYLESLFVYECEVSSSQHLVNLYGLNIEINGLILENNFDGNSFISVENSKIYLFDISFKNNTNHSIIFLSKSQLVGINITSTENVLFFLYSVQSTFTISECTIKNSKTLEGYDIFNFEEGQISIKNSIFSNNLGLIIKLLDCDNAIFVNVSFTDNFPEVSDHSKPNDIYFLNTNSEKITHITIEESYFSSKFGGISVWIAGFSNLNITKTNFNGSKTQSNFGEMALFISETNSIIIQNSNFTNYYGNAIQGFTQTDSFQNLFILENCTFSQNKGFYGSCLLLNGDFNIYLLSNIFENNLAILDSQNSGKSSGIAPVLFLKCGILSSLKCNLSIVSCNFKNNQAQFIAPTIYTETSPVNYRNNFYNNNEDSISFTDKVFSYPLKIIVTTFSSQDSQNISELFLTSGITFNMSIKIQDFFNQTIIFDNDTVLTIKAHSKNNYMKVDKNIGISSKGEFNFENLAIYGNSNQNFTLEIQGAFMAISPTILSKPDLVFVNSAFIRPCLPGEIIISDDSCQICKPNYYSFEDPMILERKYQKCSPCMANADCLGGNKVYPMPGFYKLDFNSTYMIQCFNEAACLGFVTITNSSECDSNCHLDMLKHGFCAKGNYGILCFYCERYYGKYENSEKCQKCADLSELIIMRVIALVIIVVAYILLNSAIAEKHLSKSENRDNNFNIFLKILVNHSQQIGVLLMPKIVTYSAGFKNYLKFFDYFSMGNDQIMTNECILQYFYYSPSNIHIYKLLFTTIIPIAFALICFIVWILIFLLRKNMNSFNSKLILSKLILFFILSTFLFYSLIMKTSLAIFQCQQLDITNPDVYLKQSPEIQCWSSSSGHMTIAIFLGVPCIVLWSVVFPYVLYIVLKSNYKEIFNKYSTSLKKQDSSVFQKNTDVQLKVNVITKEMKDGKKMLRINDSGKKSQWGDYIKAFSFFYRGFKMEYFYWECLIFIRKFLLSFFSVLNETLPNELANKFLILTICTFLLMNLKKSPYKAYKSNILENLSLIICLVTVLSSYWFEFIDDNSNKLFLIALCFGLNLIFFICCFVFILIEGKQMFIHWKSLKSLKSSKNQA